MTRPAEEVAREIVLKPCPFCGGAAYMNRGVWSCQVRCDDCDSSTGPGWSTRDGNEEKANAKAIEEWNKRPSDIATARAVLEMAAKVAAEEAQRCRQEEADDKRFMESEYDHNSYGSGSNIGGAQTADELAASLRSLSALPDDKLREKMEPHERKDA